MAIVEQALPARPKGPSLVVQIAVLVVLTLAAIGLGWFAGNHLSGERGPAPTAAETAEAKPIDHKAEEYATAEEGGGEHGEAASPLLVPLAAMTTNLAAPSRIWVRLELSVVLDQPQSPDLIEAIHQHIFASLRTVKLYQIEGASGYRHLKRDLEERARIRSEGHVKSVLIRTLLFE